MSSVLAFDFGASSGRAILGTCENGKITLKEAHRFSNDPVQVNGTFYWDVLRLFYEIKQGILKAKAAGGFESIGIDTWGVDFGLLDKNGRLLSNPVHYRDRRTEGAVRQSEKYISNDRLYEISGIQFMEFNTVFQLMRLNETDPAQLAAADRLLQGFFCELFARRGGWTHRFARVLDILQDRYQVSLPWERVFEVEAHYTP